MNEKLSAFVDNELSDLEARRLLVELGRDSQLRAAWERYHMIRAALRKEPENIAPATLPGAVAEAVAREPSHRDWRASATTLGKTAGGLAIAASVAVVAILSLQSPVAPRGEGASVGQVTAADQAAQVAMPIKAGVVPSADALNTYLVEHSEFAPTAGMGNMLPYVRTVSHDDNR